MKVLVLGVSGMLGHVVFRHLSKDPRLEVWGSARSAAVLRHFEQDLRKRVRVGVDVLNTDALIDLLAVVKPEVVVNCVGLIKQLESSSDPLVALPINAMLPHRLARMANMRDARLIHMSTDCVFSGSKGNYTEADPSDAADLYGKSKFIGEVDYPNAITLRTSIIGPELERATGLIGWFLKQEGAIKGYTRAIFSGLPTCELAAVIGTYVIPRPELHGVYHVAAQPISKYDLLSLTAKHYDKNITVNPDDAVAINRSLSGSRFSQATGYIAPEWTTLIERMRNFT